jgi:hypothetical protein
MSTIRIIEIPINQADHLDGDPTDQKPPDSEKCENPTEKKDENQEHANNPQSKIAYNEKLRKLRAEKLKSNPKQK